MTSAQSLSNTNSKSKNERLALHESVNRYVAEKSAGIDVADNPEKDAEYNETERSESDEATELNFDPSQCLFCNKIMADVSENLVHMQKSHGFFLADRDQLLVDVETFLAYLHLIIVGYNECLFCDAVRNGAVAIQQHMIGKSHCKYDISREDSEFLDFYNSAVGAGDSETAQNQLSRRLIDVAQLRDAHLPVGKRRKPIRPRPKAPSPRLEPLHEADCTSLDLGDAEPEKSDLPNLSQVVATRAEKREANFTTRLTRLRAEDRRALAHLPLPQQWALLAAQRKQSEKADRAGRDPRGRNERRGNKALIKGYYSDYPKVS